MQLVGKSTQDETKGNISEIPTATPTINKDKLTYIDIVFVDMIIMTHTMKVRIYHQ